MIKGLHGSNVIVTGGAVGLGYEIVRILLANEAHVLYTHIEGPTPAAKVQAEFEALAAQNATRVCGFYADLLEEGTPERIFDACEMELGKPDIFIGNAAMIQHVSIRETSPEQFETICNVNYRAGFFCIQQCFEQMKNGGRIAMIASSSVSYPAEGTAAYASSKSAVEALVRVAAIEGGPLGITAVAIEPGLTLTPAMKNGLPQAFIAEKVAQAPLGALGSPVEVAQNIVNLASPESRWINGQVVVINGGAGS